MYCCINVIYIQTIFKPSKMRILLITLSFFLFSCQGNTSEVKTSANQPESQPIQEEKQVANGIIFKDAQGNILSDAQKDSIVQSVENIQALRRYDNENNNTEYILFKDYEDLRGFIPDEAIDNLIEENRLRQTGGQGAVLNKRINDQWKDKPLPAGELKMLDGTIKTFEDFKGKVLVINFWYINCGPCIIEMPYLNNLVDKYKDEDIQFLALSFDSLPDINDFLKRTDFIYEHGSIPRSFMYDFTPVSPGHFVVDEQGIIRDILIGAPRNTEIIFDKLVSLIEKNKK
jgi:thiol-disulfide isomerase/thioredoxin